MNDTDALAELGHHPEEDHIKVPLEHRRVNTVLGIDTENQTVTIQTQGSPTEWITSDLNLGIQDCGKYTDELLGGKL